jgi:hypothetical protein
MEQLPGNALIKSVTIFINRFFLFTVGSVCRLEGITNGPRNSLKDVLNVADDARPGRSVEIAAEANALQRMDELLLADKRITIDSVATALGCSHGLAYSKKHDP